MSMNRDYNETDLKDAALQVYYHVAQQLKAGTPPEEVEAMLIKQGIKPETARNMLAKLATSQRNVAKRDGLRNLAFGGVLILLGVLIATGIGTGRPAEGLIVIGAWLTVAIGIGWCARGVWQYRQRWAS